MLLALLRNDFSDRIQLVGRERKVLDKVALTKRSDCHPFENGRHSRADLGFMTLFGWAHGAGEPVDRAQEAT